MEALRRHAITIRRLLHPPEESLPHGCSSGVLEGYLSPDYPGKENSFPFYRDSKNYSEQSGARAMMNCQTCQLKELELEPPEIKDVLRCILHTIFLHRTLSLVRPKDVDCHLLEITYVQCGLAELEKEVDEKINQFIAWVEKHPNRKSQVCLSFFEEKHKHPGWFSNKTERMYWEQWFINLHVISPKGHGKSHSSRAPKNIGGQAWEETSARRAALKLLIHEVLFQIIDFANEEKDHIPLISDRIFNHEILIPSSSDSVFGWNTDVLRRVLNSGHPYALS